MGRLLKSQDGMALLMTLLVVSLLAAVTVYFGSAMRVDYESAANLRDSIRLSTRAASVFDYGRAVLAVDGGDNTYDALTERWALAEDLTADATLFFASGCELTITDHSGLLPINALVSENGQYNEALRQSLLRLLVAAGGVSDEDAENIVDAIKDWIDADDEVTRFGAESSTYLAGERSYRCRNAPVESIGELLLVQGVTKELLYGSEEIEGVAASLTPFGREGVVNINTAPRSVLLALAEDMDTTMVEEMADFRQDPANDLSAPLWYRNIRGDVDLVGAVVQSEYFEIAATGVRGPMRRTVRGVVRRLDEKKIEVLTWKVE